jgi:hypothetical protein
MMLTFDPEKHEYRLNGVVIPSITQILAGVGLIDTTWFTEASRDRGTLVHRIIHWHLTGELDEDSVDPTLKPYFDAFLQFERDSKLTVEAIEKPMVSELYRFAGTPDIVGCQNGHNAVIDIKTGSIPAWVALQLAGQEILVNHPSIERFSLLLTGDGKYKLTPHRGRQDRQLFLSALALYHWKYNQKG